MRRPFHYSPPRLPGVPTPHNGREEAMAISVGPGPWAGLGTAYRYTAPRNRGYSPLSVTTTHGSVPWAGLGTTGTAECNDRYGVWGALGFGVAAGAVAASVAAIGALAGAAMVPKSHAAAPAIGAALGLGAVGLLFFRSEELVRQSAVLAAGVTGAFIWHDHPVSGAAAGAAVGALGAAATAMYGELTIACGIERIMGSIFSPIGTGIAASAAQGVVPGSSK